MAAVNQDTIFNAITEATTLELQSVGNLGGSLFARSIELDLSSTGVWTVDIEGRTSLRSAWHAIGYYQVNVAGGAALTTDRLTVSSSAPKQYVIPNPPLYTRLAATPSSGALTVYGSFHSEALGAANAELSGATAGATAVAGPTAEQVDTLIASVGELVERFGGAEGQPLGPLNPLAVDPGTPALGAGEEHLGSVAGQVGAAALEFTRPNDSNAYAAQDIIAPAVSAPLVLRNVARVPGGSGYITGLKISTNSATFLPALRVYFYMVQLPTLLADNALYTMLYADRVGRWFLDLPALATGGSGSDAAMAENITDRLPFTCPPGSRDLVIQIVTTAIATPSTNQQFRVAIQTELY